LNAITLCNPFVTGIKERRKKMNKNRRSIVRSRFTILCNGDTEVQRNEGNSWIYQAL